MTGFRTRAAGGSLGVIGFKWPPIGSEWDRIAEEVLLFGGMNIVANPTGSAKLILVNVKVMKVLRAVTELGFSRCFWAGDQLRIMAIKAQRIGLCVEAGIKCCGVSALQKSKVLAAVRAVATSTIIHRTMMHRVFVE